METIAVTLACLIGPLVANYFVRGIEKEVIHLVGNGGRPVLMGAMFRLCGAAAALGLPFLIHPKGALAAVFAFIAARNIALLQYGGVLPTWDVAKRRVRVGLKRRDTVLA